MTVDTILYIGGFMLPDKNAAAHRVLGNAKALRALGYNVVFIDCNKECNEVLSSKSKCYGFDRWSMKYDYRRFISIRALKNVYTNYSNVKYIIAYNYPSIALVQMLKFAKKRSVKVIADVTEWYTAAGNNLINKTLKGMDSYYRMNILQKKVDGVIAISGYLYDYYNKYVKTIVVPPTVDAYDNKWNGIKTVEDEKVRLVYAGSPGKNKDKINYIIKALDEVSNNDYVMDVLGITVQKYLGYYPEDKDLLLRLKDKVFFHDVMPHTDVLNYIKKADFSIFYREKTRVTMAGFPTKFVESISCGTPVITTRTSDLEDYLENGINGFFIDDIKSDLKRILQFDKRYLKAMKKNVDKYIFDYHKYIDKIGKVL